jgi:uncharacterized protein YjiS (DUF1127 family)
MIVPHIQPRPYESFASLGWIDLWWRRHRTRQALRDLDPHRLADIGLNEEQRTAECVKPFWRG